MGLAASDKGALARGNVIQEVLKRYLPGLVPNRVVYSSPTFIDLTLKLYKFSEWLHYVW